MKRKECIDRTLLFLSQFSLPYHKIGAHVAILSGSGGEWKRAYAAKKLRQQKTNLLKLSLVWNVMRSHNASHSILGFMQSALIDGCCMERGTSTSSLRQMGRQTFPAHSIL